MLAAAIRAIWRKGIKEDCHEQAIEIKLKIGDQKITAIRAVVKKLLWSVDKLPQYEEYKC